MNEQQPTVLQHDAIRSRFDRTTAKTDNLLTMLESSNGSHTGDIANIFTELPGLLEALPLDQGQMCYFRNRLRSSRQLWESGDVGDRNTALVQMRELHRKLCRLLSAWDEENAQSLSRGK